MATAAKTIDPHITRDPAVYGGRACVAGTRIRVMLADESERERTEKSKQRPGP